MTLTCPCFLQLSGNIGLGLEYARQDRKLVAGEAIAPKLLLRCIRTAGATRVLTVDLHNQAEAAFSRLVTVIESLGSLGNNDFFFHVTVLLCFV